MLVGGENQTLNGSPLPFKVKPGELILNIVCSNKRISYFGKKHSNSISVVNSSYASCIFLRTGLEHFPLFISITTRTEHVTIQLMDIVFTMNRSAKCR